MFEGRDDEPFSADRHDREIGIAGGDPSHHRRQGGPHRVDGHNQSENRERQRRDGRTEDHGRKGRGQFAGIT